MADMSYQVDGGNNTHIVIGEYTLCGWAWDEVAAKPTEKRTVNCPDCVSIIRELRHVRTRRPTKGAVDLATVAETFSVL